MQVQTITPTVRAEKNRMYANDGSFESVDRLLAKIAIKCFARVQAMNLGMTYDDVRQEMNVSYLMAKKLWEPGRGVLFSTYLTTACYRNFNDRIRKAETERRHLGLVNMTDMRPVDAHDDDGDAFDYIGRSDADTYLQVTQMYGNDLIDGGCAVDKEMAPMNSDPSIFLEEVQEFTLAKESAKNALSNLTPKAKAIVHDLLTAAKVRQAGEKLPTLRKLFTQHNLPEAEMKRIRQELAAAFGAKM